MTHRHFILWFAIWLLATPGSASADSNLPYGVMNWNKPCLALTRKWNGYKGWKAIAVSGLFTNLKRGDNLPYQECGHSWRAPSKDVAVNLALRQCNNGLRRGGGVGKATCTLKVVVP
jgi:hypothetical protein